jgi:hypothetical protein
LRASVFTTEKSEAAWRALPDGTQLNTGEFFL